MLIFVAHTKERWYKFFPSKQVIYATLGTQILATILTLTGFLMPARISITWVAIVWIWSFFWMQISEVMKDIQGKFLKNNS
jgi:H+-transporting ATPase